MIPLFSHSTDYEMLLFQIHNFIILTFASASLCDMAIANCSSSSSLSFNSRAFAAAASVWTHYYKIYEDREKFEIYTS